MNAIEVLYRAILSQQDASGIPTPTDLAGQVDGFVLRGASPEQIRALLPLAAACLESSIPVVRKDGMLLMSTVAVARLDNASLLEPYFEKLAAFLTDTDAGMKGPAITALVYGYPRPAPKALPYIAAHLNDDQNSGEQFRVMSGALLAGSPSDPATVRNVLAALQKRPDHETLAGGMMGALGQQKITTAEALKFIRDGLNDKNALVRLAAVEAIGNMPKGVRDGFATDLQRLLANPDESPEVHARAAQVLIQ
jgi:hypothetical protein